jgi:PAS domain S-box-containing protein
MRIHLVQVFAQRHLEATLTEGSAASEKDIGTGAATSQADLFRQLVENIREYAIFLLDPDGNVLTWNPGAQAMKGYTKEEIVGRHFSQFYLPEAVQSDWPQRELALATKEGRFTDEGWRVRKDGTSFWASVTIVALRGKDGQLSGFAKVTQDMSDRRRTEERVQSLNRELRQRVAELDESRRVVELRTLELQRLSGQLLQIQDLERRRIARELHDDLGQQLSAIAMTLPTLPGSSQVLQLVGNATATVRNLSYLLHPPLLDETGLRAALHWYVEGMAKRSGIEISLGVSPHNFPRLSPEIETTIFRIVQECLTNVYRHAESKSARVEIEKQSDWIVVRVRDHGKGMPQESHAHAPMLGVGIRGMRERVRQFGGDIIVSRAEPGTVVESRIPLFMVDGLGG